MPKKMGVAATKVAIRAAAAGFGAAFGGPLGGALGSMLGHALGGPAAEVVAEYAKRFGENAGEKLFESGGDSFDESLKGSPANLEAVYREALRLSLVRVHPEIGNDFDDWFANWEVCLSSSVSLDLAAIRPNELAPKKLDDLFSRTITRLDAQGAAMSGEPLSIVTREMPSALRSELIDCLPLALDANFNALIVQPEYEVAWKQVVSKFQQRTSAVLVRIEGNTALIPQVANDLSALLKIAEKFYNANALEGRATNEQLIAKDAEIARMAEELRNLQEQLAMRSSEPVEVRLSNLLSAGNIEGAVRLKAQQMEWRQNEADKLPRDFYELGTMQELRFDWLSALAAYREAWLREPKAEYGFKYAYVAQNQNHFLEAIEVYRALRSACTEAADISKTLNSLGVLYSGTKRMKEAEDAYGEAFSIRRTLAKANSEVYLPDVAATLNNLGLLYNDTQRIKEAEGAYGEAISIYRTLANANPDTCLPEVSTTLNNLASLYSNTQRMKEAEGTYEEALSIRRTLARDNPEAYLSYVATTLNNLAILYNDTQRMKEAEGAYGEALSIQRTLAKDNPEAYLPDVAMTLNNQAILYNDTQRMKEAEGAYGEALPVYRTLAKANPEAYLPYVATTLNNLAALYRQTQRMKEAEDAYGEALSIRRTLANANPDAYLPDVAATLNNLAILYRNTRRAKEGLELCREAEALLLPLWNANPEVHGNQMSKILWRRSKLSEELGLSRAECCAVAQRALLAAYDPSLRGSIQRAVDRFCGESTECEGRDESAASG
jgi:hypothetical protein